MKRLPWRPVAVAQLTADPGDGEVYRVSYSSAGWVAYRGKTRLMNGALSEVIAQCEVDAASRPAVTGSAFNRAVGAAIRWERQAVGMTAKQLAEAAGLSTGFISDVETGKRGISSENLVAVARAVGCRVESLLSECGRNG